MLEEENKELQSLTSITDKGQIWVHMSLQLQRFDRASVVLNKIQPTQATGDHLPIFNSNISLELAINLF